MQLVRPAQCQQTGCDNRATWRVCRDLVVTIDNEEGVLCTRTTHLLNLCREHLVRGDTPTGDYPW